MTKLLQGKGEAPTKKASWFKTLGRNKFRDVSQKYFSYSFLVIIFKICSTFSVKLDKSRHCHASWGFCSRDASPKASALGKIRT